MDIGEMGLHKGDYKSKTALHVHTGYIYVLVRAPIIDVNVISSTTRTRLPRCCAVVTQPSWIGNLSYPSVPSLSINTRAWRCFLLLRSVLPAGTWNCRSTFLIW